MASVKLGLNQIQLINTLDAVSGVGAKDCVVSGDAVVFLVPENKIRQALGKNGAMIEKIKKMLGKRVELFEYSPEPEGFFRKAFFRARIEKVEIGEKNGEKIALINADNTNKKIILQNIGRLKKIKELAKRNYGIEEVRVR